MPDWASNVEASLDAIADLAPGPRAGLALKLTIRDDRIAAIDGIDDSEGLCSDLCIARATSISPRSSPCGPIPGTARDLLPAKWMATTVRSEMPRNFTSTCSASRASPSITALP